MMTKEQMLERYDELYAKMANAKDVRHMRTFGDASSWVFKEMVKAHPEVAESWLSHLEAICWNNHLSEKEAMNISKRTVNQDGSKGFHWPMEIFGKTVESLGGKLEDKPYYDAPALWTMANIIYSDHAGSIAEDMGFKTPAEVPAEKMALSCYKKAVERLKDPDNPFLVRKYFKHKMYDDSPVQA